MNSRSGFYYAVAALIALGSALFMALDFNLAFTKGNNYAVATVNGTPIPKAEYARALDAMQSGLERPLSQADKDRAIKILIDEELIVQEALRLNLASDDRLVRKNLIQALINSAVLLDYSDDANEAILRDFYAQETLLFSEPLSVTLKVLRISDKTNIRHFLDALDTGSSFYEAGEAAKFTQQELPEALPIGKVGESLGGKARDLVLTMNTGDIAGPVESTGEDIYIWLVNKRGGILAYEQVMDSVKIEWQRRQEEKALEKYLIRLRKQARIKDHSKNYHTN